MIYMANKRYTAFVTLVKKRTVGWNPNRAKEAAERRKASGEAAPTALGSRPDAGKELHEWVLAEEAKEKAAFEAMATPAAAGHELLGEVFGLLPCLPPVLTSPHCH